MNTDNRIERLTVSAYEVPTDYPEADGTIAWRSTTMVYVEVKTAGKIGIGFSYADKATAMFIESVLKQHVEGQDAMSVNRIFVGLAVAVRNHGRPGVASMAISAVDVALWEGPAARSAACNTSR